MHDLRLIIHNHACKRQHLAYLTVHYKNKSSGKILAKMVKIFQEKVIKCINHA